MKIDVKENDSAVYPRLMTLGDTTMVVLFYSVECGTVIVSGESGWSIGEYQDRWDITGFVEFKGQIVMEND